LLLLPLEFLQLLLPVLLQQLLELSSFLTLPLLSFFSFLLRLLLWLLLHLLWLLLSLPLALLLLLLPLLLDGVELDGPRRPPRNRGSLDLLVHGPAILRKLVTDGHVTYSDRIPLDPRSGKLGGSLLFLRARHLDPVWRRWGGLPHQWTRRGALDTLRRPRNGGAYKHSKAKKSAMMIDIRVTRYRE